MSTEENSKLNYYDLHFWANSRVWRVRVEAPNSEVARLCFEQEQLVGHALRAHSKMVFLAGHELTEGELLSVERLSSKQLEARDLQIIPVNDLGIVG